MKKENVITLSLSLIAIVTCLCIGTYVVIGCSNQGETGIQGIQGVQGLRGYTGDEGDEGDRGRTGDDGDDGEDGIQGPAGIDEINSVLVLSQKDLVTWVSTGTEITVTYTVVGDTFEVSGVPEDYVAVYYPNTETYAHWDGVVIFPEDVSTNLPMSNDLNGMTISDYCTNEDNPDASVCYGAKIWVVPSEDIVYGKLTWEHPEDYYFETDLITYTHTA